MALQVGFLAVVSLLAYANGANDNPKGVATLLGAGVSSFRTALILATTATLGGALCSTSGSRGLMEAFTGHGLVAQGLPESPSFLGTVGLAAGLTVLLATWLGLPISTTHSLLGALLGAGLAASGTISMGYLARAFLVPLAFSPLVGLLLTLALASAFRLLCSRDDLSAGRTGPYCICFDGLRPASLAVTQAGGLLLQEEERVAWGTISECERAGGVRILWVDRDSLLRLLHLAAALAVSFARALNDAPKMASLLVVVPGLSVASGYPGLVWIGVVMGLGGILSCRRVAETMAYRITAFDPVSGMAASTVTASLVIMASLWGLPVSTTHVAVGSFIGAGLANGEVQWVMVRTIGSAWLITVPVAFILSGVVAVMVV
ncbi:MAG: hypothetical protein Kow00109_18160 [Acidobacteriota bacterium]